MVNVPRLFSLNVGQLRLKLGGSGTVTFEARWGWDSYV